ncbi:MAG: hypothetical protein NC833_05715 [Candidatus Omnitrophica bacterium]|nr:hypothetical protein [Candidatus Omnitrophota bacterium]
MKNVDKHNFCYIYLVSGDNEICICRVLKSIAYPVFDCLKELLKEHGEVILKFKND